MSIKNNESILFIRACYLVHNFATRQIFGRQFNFQVRSNKIHALIVRITVRQKLFADVIRHTVTADVSVGREKSLDSAGSKIVSQLVRF